MKIYIFRRNSLTWFLTFILLLGIISLLDFRPAPAVQDVFYAGLDLPSVIIDAGHGGIDGGASSPSGTTEAPLNLDIAFRLRDLFYFMGIRPVLTRSDDRSLDYSAENTIRENKRADLQARLSCSRQWEECPFLSIHLNKYAQAEYRGAQVFYSPNHPSGQHLAASLQDALCSGLDPQNSRRAKLAPEGIFLMEEITAPAVTIECGFLSNPQETILLETPEYRTKIAASICCGYIDYLQKT